MAEQDPRCVLAVREQSAAELMVAWLIEKGHPSEVVVTPPGFSSDSVTHATQPEAAVYQVCVLDLAGVDAAKELIEEQRAGVAALRELEAKRANRTGTVSAACEECGKSSHWPAAAMGTTETCPHCGAYMDVPDPDDDGAWADVDFGTEEGEDGETPEEGAK